MLRLRVRICLEHSDRKLSIFRTFTIYVYKVYHCAWKPCWWVCLEPQHCKILYLPVPPNYIKNINRRVMELWIHMRLWVSDLFIGDDYRGGKYGFTITLLYQLDDIKTFPSPQSMKKIYVVEHEIYVIRVLVNISYAEQRIPQVLQHYYFVANNYFILVSS